MSKETTTQNQSERPVLSVKRTTEEIQARIEAVEKEMRRNEVYIHNGFSRKLAPEALRAREIFLGKLDELHWLLGEDVDITRWVY